MQEQVIIELLWRYGHFRNPAYAAGTSHNVTEANVQSGVLKLSDEAVREALRSYQHLQKPVLDDIASRVHGRRAIADGFAGPATDELLNMPRCGCADYGPDVAEALGSGSWGRCVLDKYPDNHAVTVSWDLSGCPSFLKPVFDQVFMNVVAAYVEIGIAFVRQDGNARANIQASFRNLSGSTIGLAIVGPASCSQSIWARFDPGYNPANTIREWTTLVKHELGHNMGLQHSSGGVMNPSIVAGLPISWKGDPSHSTLARWFGGEPVPQSPGPFPTPVPVPPGSGAIPDLEVIYKGRPYTCFPKAQV